MRFLREIQPRLRLLAEHFPAIVLTGARQTGKTTLLRETFPQHTYVSLDLPSAAEKADRDPEQFLRDFPPPVIVDEVQYAPKLFRHLKVAIDAQRDRRGQFLLTGSQKFTLMREVSDSLAGRVGLLELETLSLGEVQEALPSALSRLGPAGLLARGFFPQLWAEPTFPSMEFHSSYLSTYLERDVRQLMNVGLRDFERFMRACALRSGQTLNKSELARDVGIHHKTATEWLSILHASNQIILLEPYFSNETKRITKQPKMYFAETGTACALLGLNEKTIETSAHVGALWETFIFSQLRKYLKSFGSLARLGFYRESSGLEVEFVLEDGGALDLIEAKWTQYPQADDAASMKRLRQKLKSVRHAYVVCRTDTSFPLGEATAVNGLSSKAWLPPI